MKLDLKSVVRVPLSQKYLEQSVALVNRIFPDDRDTPENASEVLPASLKPGVYRATLDALGIRSLAYWISLYQGVPVAIVGLYRLIQDAPSTIRLGWFGVDKSVRQNGLGRRELVWAIEQAKAEGAQALMLYTSDLPGEAEAQRLYESLGLTVYATQQQDGYTKIYRNKLLT